MTDVRSGRASAAGHGAQTLAQQPVPLVAASWREERALLPLSFDLSCKHDRNVPFQCQVCPAILPVTRVRDSGAPGGPPGEHALSLGSSLFVSKGIRDAFQCNARAPAHTAYTPPYQSAAAAAGHRVHPVSPGQTAAAFNDVVWQPGQQLLALAGSASPGSAKHGM